MIRRHVSASRAASGRPAPRSWGVLVVEGPHSLADDLAVVVGGEGLGSESCPGADGCSVVRFYFPTEQTARAKRDEVRHLLAAAGREAGTCKLRVEPVVDPGWVEAYQASLRPFDLGARFRVHPEGRGFSPPDGGGRVPIRLVPGQAFGTGEHATTRLCVGLLERSVRRGERWVDLGCGTGILSIVAHHCGAAEVWALDHDPQAVTVAREVLAANHLEGRVRVSRGSVGQAARRQWHGAVANVELSFFLADAALLARLLRPAGALVASGFLECDVDEVAAAFRGAGLAVLESALDGPWAAVVAKRVGC